KRKAPPVLLRIRTRSGREITATPYHPLFTLRHGELHALKAEEVQVGVRVALPRRLPCSSGIGSRLPQEALERFVDADRIYVPRTDALTRWADQELETF